MGQAAAARKHIGGGRSGTDWNALWITEIRRAVLWLPVGLGLGIWLYFSLEVEPDPRLALLVLVPGLLLVTGLAWRGGLLGMTATLALFSIALGFAVAVGHAHRLNGQTLSGPINETVEGRVIGISRSQSGAPRLLLDDLVIYGLDPRETPVRARVTLRPDDDVPEPGARILIYARIAPPSGPVEPGGFDFRQRAYFQQLGAIGYALGVVVPAVGGERGSIVHRISVMITKTRLGLAAYLRDTIKGPAGAFAAALIVGDRSAIADTDADALRASNLAHLLAISGLHMGILTGMVFVSFRIGLTLVPGLGLWISTKKLAAFFALLAGAVYLGLSGATIATQRAFIMVAVALLAVQLDRPALSLRALAVAASIVLLIRPVSLLDVGFQMSFAATTALVAGYEAIRTYRQRRIDRGAPSPGWPVRLAKMAAVYVGGLLMTSLLAGIATAPYSAFHFNRMAPYGLPANLAAVPVMGVWVAPMALLSAVIAPLGLAPYSLNAMALGIDWILFVAHWIANLPGAVSPIAEAPGWVLPAVTLGGLWLALWRGPWRLLGVIPLTAALIGWAQPANRPDLLISSDGRIVGLMTELGRTLDKDKAAGFVAEKWLGRDGDLTLQADAAARPGLSRTGGLTEARLANGHTVLVARGRAIDLADLQARCVANTTIVAFLWEEIDGPCDALTMEEIRPMGALALWQEGDGIRIVSALQPADRLWSGGP